MVTSLSSALKRKTPATPSPASRSVLFASPPSPLTFRIREELPRIPSALTPSPFFATPEFQPKAQTARLQPGPQDYSSDESSVASSGGVRKMGSGRRATNLTAPDRKSKFPVVTCVAVDENYDFPRSELAAMAKNLSRLIDDIDRLSIDGT